jgi:hypothetical protein
MVLVGLSPVHAFAQSKRDAADSGSGSSSTKKKRVKKKSSRAAEREEAAEAERSQSEDDEAPSQGSKRKKKRATKELETSETLEAATNSAPTESAAPVTRPGAKDEDDDLEDNPSKWMSVLSKSVPPRRYAYILGGAIAGVGLVFAYQAQGEAKRAETTLSASEAQQALTSAHAAAAVSNLLYGLAIASVLLALVLEFVPEPIANKAALTYHF